MLLKLSPLKKNTVSILVTGMEERIFRLKDSQEIQFDKFPQCPTDRELCLWEKTVLLERCEQSPGNPLAAFGREVSEHSLPAKAARCRSSGRMKELSFYDALQRGGQTILPFFLFCLC